MAKYDHILKQTLENVYFIWGNDKTAVAEALAEKYLLYVYHTDNIRNKHIKKEISRRLAGPGGEVSGEPVQETPEDARQAEQELLREFTPMVVSELIALSAIYGKVLCEGELDFGSLLPIATHIVMISDGEDESNPSDCTDEEQMLEELGAKQIIRGEEMTVDEIAEEVAKYFGFAEDAHL